MTETFSGLSPRPRPQRKLHLEALFIRKLSDPKLFFHLQQHVYAQDVALKELASRLRMEALTRQAHQPLR